MTIVLIKKGIKPEQLVYQGKCVYCNSVVQASPSDGRVVSDQRDGNFFSITCPNCSRQMHIDIKESNRVS